MKRDHCDEHAIVCPKCDSIENRLYKRIAALEAELAEVKRAPLLSQTAELGLQQCEFNDECDFCDDPKGLYSWCSVSSGERYTETDFYICEKCIPEYAKQLLDAE